MKFALAAPTISSLELRPDAPWNVPSLSIHLSSILFSLLHSVHLHWGPLMCPAESNFWTEVSKKSSKVILICDFSCPLSLEQPSRKCLYNPLELKLALFQADLVAAYLAQISVVLYIYIWLSIFLFCCLFINFHVYVDRIDTEKFSNIQSNMGQSSWLAKELDIKEEFCCNHVTNFNAQNAAKLNNYFTIICAIKTQDLYIY